MSTRELLRDAACAYADLGWRVVPVLPGGKKPSDGVGWQQAGLRRTTEQLRRHWTKPFNVGVMLGPASDDLVDVDLDCSEATFFADECLPPGAFVFGRPGRPRSHRLYRAPGVHLLQLRDVNRSMLVELRAKPAAGEGAQTVLPPSVHPSGEVVAWEEDNDGSELPARVDAAHLISAVRRVAVASFLARQLGGIAPARGYLDTPAAGLLSADAAAHARELAGLPPIREQPRREARAAPVEGDGLFARLRQSGIRNTAALLGLDWDDRRRALVICPACRSDARGSHDWRPAAGVLKAGDTGVELWTHGKCGHTGDAVSLAAAAVLGTLKPASKKEWSDLATALRARGWE